jgi:hypothetical protein
MRRFLSIIILLTTVAVAAIAAGQGRPVWEPVNSEAAASAIASAKAADSDNFESEVINGALYIYAPRRINIKVFTILGQPISQETLEPGIWKLNIPKRGIYILKIGSQTRRVTI